MKYVAVEGMMVVPVEEGVEISGVIVETGASAAVKVDEKGVYSGDITVTVATAIFNGYTAADLTFTLHPSAEYTSVDGKKVLLEDDTSDTVTATGYMPPSQSTNFPVTIKVLSAMQTYMKAE